MGDSIYSIKTYRPADFQAYTQFIVEVEKLEPTGQSSSPQILCENLHRPGFSPEKDLLIAKKAGNIVGYLDITPELVIGRVIFNCLVHPEHRRRGLATRLIRRALRRAGELGVKTAHVNIPQGREIAKTVFAKLGFRFVRRFIQLRLVMEEVRWQDAGRLGLQWRQMLRGEEDKLALVQNRSFAGTWGYNPNTVEEIVYRTNSSGCSPGDVILACEGERVVGYCWTRITGEASSDRKTGQILMIGVEPEYRGKGIGKGVLLAGLSHLKNNDVRTVEITVDSENTVACSLYRSVGFKEWDNNLWYEKAVD